MVQYEFGGNHRRPQESCPVLYVWPERRSKNQAVIKLVRGLVVCANSAPASGGQIH
jgi:hypothetical protein